MEKYLTGPGIMEAAVVLLALAWAYNLIYTARTNARKEKELRDAPLTALKQDIEGIGGRLTALDNRVSDLERGTTAHEQEIDDLHRGQTELCRGVQALLEHALHNGNAEEMQAASLSIGKWLRNR